MRLICATLALAVLLPVTGWADSSRCYSIRNADLKNNCLATTRNDKSRCYSIRDRDLKNSCLATVGHDKSRCYSIRNQDQKQQCLAGF